MIEAQDLLRRLAQTFPTFTAWAEHVAAVGQLTGYLSTDFGWTLQNYFRLYDKLSPICAWAKARADV